jgi:hypothetical protein
MLGAMTAGPKGKSATIAGATIRYTSLNTLTMEDLSTILSAVKPKERTDQYKILGALYCLGGTSKAVKTTEIQALLRLNLGSKTPRNISARLREYSAYVRIVEKGPPLQWGLKEQGLARLRDLSGLALAGNKAEVDFATDIGIVCALEQPEFAAVTEALGGAQAWNPIGSARFPHVYRSCGMVTDGGLQLSVVGTTSTSKGLTAA